VATVILWFGHTWKITILPDIDFFHTALQKVETFFKCCILPEILGKWYTRSVEMQVIRTDKLQTELPSLLTKPVICYCCKGDPTEDMICSSGICKIVKFHSVCLGLKWIPKKKWNCPDCCKILNKLK